MGVAVISFLAFAASQVGTPGPANMALLATGARFGFRSALPFVAGVALGKQLIIWPVGFGLMELAAHAPWVFSTLKYASAAYIFWLAWKVANLRLDHGREVERVPGFVAGLIVHPLNPKAWAMIVAGFTNFVVPGTPALHATMVIAAGLGYAVPGGVIAVGLMVPMAALDNLIDDIMEAAFGIDTGLLITGSIWLMVVAYMARFMAAALNAYDSGMATVPAHYDAIGRSLGQPGPKLLWRVHLPVARTSVLTALLIVFVDVMKELPATLILHPFNFQTLAVQAHRLASDERLAQAAVPSLVLVGFGLVPVALLCRTLGRDNSTGRRSAKMGTAIHAG